MLKAAGQIENSDRVFLSWEGQGGRAILMFTHPPPPPKRGIFMIPHNLK